MTHRARVLLAYGAARRRRFPDREALRAWQEARLRRVLARARVRYPYYRDVAAAELEAFPVVDRSVALARFAELNDRGLALEPCLERARAAERRRDFTASLDGLAIGLSSGTSGRQGVFLTSPAERARWAGAVLAKALPRGLLGGARVALVLRAGGPLYESVGSRRVAFRFLDLARPPGEHLPALAAFGPTVLAAPPPVLRFLAEARLAGALDLRLERVFSVAEVLDPQDERVIETGLGRRVDQIYQATEGFLGISCAAGRLHLNEDLLVVEQEPLDERGSRFTPVVTDLSRTSQAVIRMRLDDVLVRADEPCPCGSPLQVVHAVEGRADDVLLFPRADDRGQLGPFFADFVRAAVLAAPGVEDFRAVQASPGSLGLWVRPDGAQEAAAAALVRVIGAAGLVPPSVTRRAAPAEAPLEKRRRVRRTFPAPGAAGPPARPR
jgi:putative adenylate-forming enzyme